MDNSNRPRRGRPNRRHPASATITRSRSRSPSLPATVRWNLDNPANWDIPVLRQKLQELGIVVPTSGMTKKTLLSLYHANVYENISDGVVDEQVRPRASHVMSTPAMPAARPARSISPELVQPTLILRNNNSGRPRIRVRNPAPAVTSSTTLEHQNVTLDSLAADFAARGTVGTDTGGAVTSLHALGDSGISGITRAELGLLRNSAESTRGSSAISGNTREMSADIMTSGTHTSAVNNVEFLQRELIELRELVSDLRQPGTVPSTATAPFSTIAATGVPVLYTSFATGLPVAPDSLPYVENVSASMRKQIVEGKLVNLAALLIPHSEAPDCRTTEFDGLIYKIRDDPRLNKILTLGEFISAFTVYRNVLCESFPHRRIELDAYLRHIVQLATQYGGSLFYEYHRMFASKSAAWVAKGVLVNWALLDTTLYCTVTSGHRTRSCSICQSLAHASDMCPTLRVDNSGPVRRGSTSNRFSPYDRNNSNNSNNSNNRNLDSYGRTRQFHNNAEVCNNFNYKTCFRGKSCHFTHVCVKCKSTSHGSSQCGEGKKSQSRNHSPSPDSGKNSDKSNKKP
jgi:hypothetical protein